MPKENNLKNRKLIQLLQFLDVEEWKAFDKYVQSPYFNTNSNVVELVSYLKKNLSNHKLLTISKVFRKVYKTPFPKESKVAEQKLNDLFNKCKYLLQNFIALRFYEGNDFLKDISLLEGLLEKNAHWFFENRLKKIKSTYIEKKELKILTYYQQVLQLTTIEHSYNLRKNSRTKTNSLQKEIDQHINDIFIINKLRYYCVLLNHQLSASKSNVGHISFIKEILVHLGKYPIHKEPLINIWHFVALLLHSLIKEDSSNITLYAKAKKYLRENGHNLIKGELRQIYTVLITYATIQKRKGQQEYEQELFEIYKFMIKKELLLIDGYLQPSAHFTNIVTVALTLKEIDWAQDFITNSANILHPNNKDFMLTYCLANVHFHKQEYDKAIEKLIDFAQKEDFNYIEHKVLLVKVYYEISAIPLAHLLDTFNKFLYNHRATLPENTCITHKNFIKIVRLLNDYKDLESRSRKQKCEKIKKEIKKMKYLTSQTWLEEKLAELLS